MSSETFYPSIADATNTVSCSHTTSTNSSAVVKLPANRVLIKCHTDEVVVRPCPVNGSVTRANGWYMNVGDVLRLEITKHASHLAIISAEDGNAGVIVMMPGDGA